MIATELIAELLVLGSFLRTTMVNKFGELVLADIRRAVFSRVMNLSANWFESNRTGDVVARITTDTTVVQTVVTSTLSMATRNLLLLIGVVVIVVLSSPKMSLVVIMAVPAGGITHDHFRSALARHLAPCTRPACRCGD